jgi:hypothetical protein
VAVIYLGFSEAGAASRCAYNGKCESNRRSLTPKGVRDDMILEVAKKAAHKSSSDGEPWRESTLL